MNKINIAFDVDGTLRCNCSESCSDPNQRIVELFKILQTFKNVELYVWSGGGAQYARNFADMFRLGVPASRCISKIAAPKMDIAIDDMHDFELAAMNLIVREK